ncbi:MAG: DUF1249 domain-containing protein [Gammaproteobacteria bacterium]|nr:DUF1249 domain-containing protein [Gammaproteobacteria bacterium]MDH3506733.1 DUF1249 domain-containing protein [Gammaproteobacteria bacterium]
MLVDSLIVPECIYRPGSFSGLMTVYESNFIKLARLVADLDDLSAESLRISRSPRDLDLHAEVQQREPYTTTLKLTYWFEDGRPELVPDPDLVLRVYHDARLVEAVAGREDHRHAKLREIALRHSLELGRRWRNNIMLNKWLDYLLEMGHAFP